MSRAVRLLAAALWTLALPLRAQAPAISPAESLYVAASDALDAGRYGDAARLFQAYAARYPRSAHTHEAFYWEAFALYRRGAVADLRRALDVLAERRRRFPRALGRDDADALALRLETALARVAGDSGAAARVRGVAERDVGCAADDSSLQTEALNGLARLDERRAGELLRRLLPQWHRCSRAQRLALVLLATRLRGPDADSLLAAALRSERDSMVRVAAGRALADRTDGRDVRSLDQFLLDPAVRLPVKEQVLAAAGEHPDASELAVLYRRLTEPRLRAQVIALLAARRTDDAVDALVDLASRETDAELRARALDALRTHPSPKARQAAARLVKPD